MNFEGADIYVDAVGAIQFNGSVVKIDFLTLYPDPQNNKNLQPRLAGRLALPVSAVLQLSESMNRFVEELKKAKPVTPGDQVAALGEKAAKP